MERVRAGLAAAAGCVPRCCGAGRLGSCGKGAGLLGKRLTSRGAVPPFGPGCRNGRSRLSSRFCLLLTAGGGGGGCCGPGWTGGGSIGTTPAPGISLGVMPRFLARILGPLSSLVPLMKFSIMVNRWADQSTSSESASTSQQALLMSWSLLSTRMGHASIERRTSLILLNLVVGLARPSMAAWTAGCSRRVSCRR